jgi:hypothetical protein
MSKKSERIEQMREWADARWPGSGSELVAVYMCLAHVDWLSALMLIRAAVGNPILRADSLMALRQKVEGQRSSKRGPKLERYEAAKAALDRLDAKVREA